MQNVSIIFSLFLASRIGVNYEREGEGAGN
jgi:hypothetical protein